MNIELLSKSFYIGWDVGAWHCGRSSKSQDAIVILDSDLSLIGKHRGNIRCLINESLTTLDFLFNLFSLCKSDMCTKEQLESVSNITLAIDTPLGFSTDFVKLVTGLKYSTPVRNFKTNSYLFRQTEQYLFTELNLRPMSPVQDQIGSQATKGMHVLAKFASNVDSCGVWSDGKSLTAIEAYPSSCKHSKTIETLYQRIGEQPGLHADERDAITCALIAYLFAKRHDELIPPGNSIPVREGWIWVPKDISKNEQVPGS